VKWRLHDMSLGRFCIAQGHNGHSISRLDLSRPTVDPLFWPLKRHWNRLFQLNHFVAGGLEEQMPFRCL